MNHEIYIWGFVEGLTNGMSIVNRHHNGFVKYPISISCAYTLKGIQTVSDKILQRKIDNEIMEEILRGDEE